MVISKIFQSPWLIYIKGRLKTNKTGFQTTFFAPFLHHIKQHFPTLSVI
ncbi:hypothetical protein MCC93_24200 [Morococcus cerebrosus]|uniref:Uncharacterized protein n=1 Tax=Morococcus cerebrosus TaxID=1056807 RepID=A0A0C1GKZ3_9NEIS|nr:hypothetical protein MCC93_24200 [Morococcus cerebrosus]